MAGPDATKPEYVSFDGDATYAGDDLKDFTVSGLAIRQPEPLKTAEIEFADDELELSLHFAGIHAPFSWNDNAGGLREWIAHDRYEQSCVTTGRLALRGREIEFTGVGHRDHSWGTRDWRPFQHWKWMNAGTHDGTVSLHAMKLYALGEEIVYGYLNRAGVVTRVTHVDVAAELDEAMMHRRVHGTVTDETGAAMSFDAHAAAAWSMPIHTHTLNEVGMSAVLDGRPAVAHVEFGWPTAYLTALAEKMSATLDGKEATAHVELGRPADYVQAPPT